MLSSQSKRKNGFFGALNDIRQQINRTGTSRLPIFRVPPHINAFPVYWATTNLKPPSHSAQWEQGGRFVPKSKMFMMLLFVALVFGVIGTAKAQSGDIYFNLGTATDKSNNQSIDTFGDGNLFTTPKMTGLFGGFGGSFMFRPSLGFGAQYFARFSQGSYAGLNYRPKFYDFNAIWKPIPKSKFVEPVFQAGIGGASLSFYLPPQCNSIACSSSSLVASSRHFQTHLGAGINLYVKGGIFVRPQVDVHYVKNFFQFGSNWAPAYSVAIGYTFGRPWGTTLHPYDFLKALKL
jgi:hypothetical protein